MPLKTRGSSALDKAQRRLAQIKSIHDNLDLGHGLTAEAYNQLIEMNRATLEAHNTLLSNLEESRKTVAQLDKALSEFSARMLSGVGSVYGRNSIEYAKAGGSSRRRSSKPSPTIASITATTAPQMTQTTTSTESASSNGKVTTVY
jgi:hypothetical protein